MLASVDNSQSQLLRGLPKTLRLVPPLLGGFVPEKCQPPKGWQFFVVSKPGYNPLMRHTTMTTG